MKAKARWILGGFGIIAVLFVAAALYFSWQLVLIGTAYKAKVLCSGVFVAKWDPHAILPTDLLADDLWPLRYFDAKVDYGSQSVTATLWGMEERKAVYRPGLGCVLTHGASEERLRRWAGPDPQAVPVAEPGWLWPAGERVVTNPPPAGVGCAPAGECAGRGLLRARSGTACRMRAVVVVYQGRIISEGMRPASRRTPLSSAGP